MKQTLLILMTGFLSQIVIAQSFNTCTDAANSTSIVADVVYSVGDINGDMPPLNCAENSNGSNGEWIKYIPTADYAIIVSSDLSQNSSKDTRVNIFVGECGNLVCAGGDDDGGTNFLSVVTLNVFQGNTYYIVWDNRWGNSSNFDFILTESPQPPPPPEAPITFNPQGVTNPTGSSSRGLVDMNGDFLDDIITIQSSSVNISYQLAAGGFNYQSITDITFRPPDNEGDPQPTTVRYLPTWSLAAGDWDANGYNDLLYGGNSGVTFMKASSSGAAYTEISGPEYVFSQRSHFVDINNDGDLDAFVCHDVDPNVYYLNDGSDNLQFFQGPNPNGVPSGLGNLSSGGNYGTIWIDYNNDGLLDMFIAKCRGGDVPAKINELWRNKGMNAQGKYEYEEVGGNPGVNLRDPMQTWSGAWADFDNDGYMDVFVGASSLSDGPSKLMRNNGDGTFTDVTSGAGFDLSLTSIENIAADFDNDGNVDILFSGGIYFGNGDLTFNYFNVSMPSVGGVGDANNDGFLDVFSGAYFRNSGNDNNWVKITTVGKGHETNGLSNRNGIGARVEISTGSGIDEKIQIRDVRSGEGFRFMGSLNTHFGIGQATSINYIKIKWPSGIVDQINDPDINTHHIVEEASFTLSVEDTLVDNLILYPNPTKDYLNLNFNNLLYNGNYSVIDLSGKLILNAQLSSNKIDVSNIANGIYFLSVTSEGKTQTQRFIKQ